MLERSAYGAGDMGMLRIPITNKTGQNRPSKLITNFFLTLLQSVNKGGITKFRVDLKLFLTPPFAPSNITYSDDASLTAP